MSPDAPSESVDPATMSELVVQLQRLNANIELDIRTRTSWKVALRNGLLAAIGGLLGSTVLLTVLVKLAEPLNQMAALKPAIDRLAEQEEHSRRR